MTREGNGLIAVAGSADGTATLERRVDQDVVNHGTRPLDGLSFALKPP